METRALGASGAERLVCHDRGGGAAAASGRGYKRLRRGPPESAVEFMVERERKIGPCQGAEPACGRAPKGAERRPSPGGLWRALDKVQS